MKSNIITIDGDEIAYQHSEEHGFLMNTAQVARGYGVQPEVIRQHKRRHADELIHGNHWITVGNPTGVTKSNAGQRRGNETVTMWTRLGAYTLGFFIKSERAKKFRRIVAEDLVRRESAPTSTDTSAVAMAITSMARLLQIHDEHIAAQEAHSRRLTLGLHNLQSRVEALEAAQQPLRSHAPSAKLPLFTLLDIDRALFTAESADWWVGTSTQLRDTLAKAGLHLRQLGLHSFARAYPQRCVNLTSIARGKQRVYAIFRPGFVPDSLAMTLVRQQARNLAH